jgi:hypothetical protein
MTFFVACNGSDDWLGRLSQPDDSGSDGPFATIARARDAVRFLSKDERSREPVSIVVRGGTYLLEEALCFGPEDSGVEAAPVTYATVGRHTTGTSSTMERPRPPGGQTAGTGVSA